MGDLPELGVGVMWFAGLDPLVQASDELIDFYEVEPATFSFGPGTPTTSDGPLAGLVARGRPVVAHGVSCPVGGTVGADEREQAAFAAAADSVGSPWLSEHLSVDRLRDRAATAVPTGFFLPPAQSPEAVEVAAQQLRKLARLAGRPVAFETGVNYLRPQPGDLSDGAFFAAVAEAADCSILCDLHNLWCNEHNGRQPVTEVLGELPLERICEVHLAGGQHHDGFKLDAHSGLVEPALEALAWSVVERLPALRAITFELMPDYVMPNGIVAQSYRHQLERLQALWDVRGRNAGPVARRSRREATASHEAWDPVAWERAMAAALAGDRSPLNADPGIEVYRHLIATIRAGSVVTSLPLSYRFLALSHGVGAAERVLERYRTAVPPSAWANEEARAFSTFLREQVTDIAHLDEIIDFELAAHEAAATGTPRTVRFSCDPAPLIDALRRGVRPPADLPWGDLEVTVSP